MTMMPLTDENKVLNLYPIDYPFETLVQRVLSSPPKLILNPDFQRKYKWDKDGYERSSKFIESCLMRIPLPACYFVERLDGTHEVIDGVQRITTIMNFFNDEFALEGLTIFQELNGKKFSELGDYKNELEGTTMRCIILRKENPKEVVQEIFARLNQGAVQLSPQEIRHAIYPGSLDDLLTELGNEDVVQNFAMGENSQKRKDSLENEEMVLRFFALEPDDLEGYESFKKYLDSYMETNQNLLPDKIIELKNEFLSTLEKCILIFETNVFSNPNYNPPRQGLVYYDLLMWSFRDLDREFLVNNKEKIKELFAELCREESFTRTLSGGLQQKGAILRRRGLWKNKISQLKA